MYPYRGYQAWNSLIGLAVVSVVYLIWRYRGLVFFFLLGLLIYNERTRNPTPPSLTAHERVEDGLHRLRNNTN